MTTRPQLRTDSPRGSVCHRSPAHDLLDPGRSPVFLPILIPVWRIRARTASRRARLRARKKRSPAHDPRSTSGIRRPGCPQRGVRDRLGGARNQVGREHVRIALLFVFSGSAFSAFSNVFHNLWDFLQSHEKMSGRFFCPTKYDTHHFPPATSSEPQARIRRSFVCPHRCALASQMF